MTYGANRDEVDWRPRIWPGWLTESVLPSGDRVTVWTCDGVDDLMMRRLSLPVPQPKGASRLQSLAQQRSAAVIAGRNFRHAVCRRDGDRCRCCSVKVKHQLARDPKRAEVHHLHGRLGIFRYLDRCAILLCSQCHERVTGKVNDRLFAVATKLITVDGRPCVDARADIRFETVR